MGPHAATMKSSGGGEKVNLPTLFLGRNSVSVPRTELAAGRSPYVQPLWAAQ
jgi:hypothetical protein